MRLGDGAAGREARAPVLDRHLDRTLEVLDHHLVPGGSRACAAAEALRLDPAVLDGQLDRPRHPGEVHALVGRLAR